ncbi:MAG TPA: hypothetical protein VI796_04090 [Candidatus Thermoplasmatota archaeon]|nr:hypothetical protein [Candidatus Thermoplasmatota archaeon]
MSTSYTVTKRGPRGEPLEIHCDVHPGCTWRMQSTGPKADDDLIFVAQFRNHLEVAKTPDVQAFGHLRRSRR